MSLRPRQSWLVPALLMGLLLPAMAGAQVAGSAVVRGEVHDVAGVAVSGARVELRDGTGRVLGSTETDGQGRYVLLGLPPGGPYVLAAEHPRLGAAENEGLHLAAGESRRLVLVLDMRPVELPGLRVRVSPDLTFSGTRTGARTVLEERAIRSLPTIDRDIVAFAALSPMASIHEGSISVAGQNARFNSLRIDGAVAQDLFGLSPSGVPGGQAGAKPLPMEAIHQYSVLVAPYDVRQAGFTGGLLDATTRAGGDRWEGTAFAYYRDASFSGDVHDSEFQSVQSRGPSHDFRTQTAGFALGGPLGAVRIFAAGEVERRNRPLPGIHLDRTEALLIRLHPDSVNRLVHLLDRVHGMDPGSPGTYTLENPLGNLFVRLDAPSAGRHELTAHYNYIAASDDVPAGRMGFGPYQLTSAATRLETGTHSLVGRLGSRLGDRTTNQLLLNVQRTVDRTVAMSDLPQVEVLVSGRVDGQVIRRHVQAGGDPLAHHNSLEQTAVRLSNSLSHARGDHLFTAGIEANVSAVSRTNLPASRGIWRFNSLAELEADLPWAYERLVLDPWADPAVRFGLLQLAAYLGDEWVVGDALTLTLGLRLDLPVPLARPGHNQAAESTTGVATHRMPSGNVQVSPRVGFNYAPATRRQLQFRGGVGLFAGAPPLAWIADAHANTGLRTSFLTCTDGYTVMEDRIRQAPGLTSGEPPAACLTGAGAVAGDVTFFAEGFRYPQDLRASIGLDRELPWSIIATLDAVYTRAIHQVALEDINLGSERTEPIEPRLGYPGGIGTRPIFGVPRLLPDRFGVLTPQRRWDEYGRIIRVGNRSRNAAFAVAAEVQRRFSDRLDFRLAYSFTRAVDTRTLLYQDATRNYGLTPVRYDPGRPEPRLSGYDRPHRVMGTVWSRLASWGDGLDAGIVFVGQSGLPYSYVYDTDMNGDGFPGPGAAAEAYNDLVYIPINTSEVLTDVVSTAMLFQLVAAEPCLQETRGAIVARNTCRTPWSNRLDLRLSQGLRLPTGRLSITADVLNVLNLLNRDWGLLRVAPPVVPIFSFDRRVGCPGVQCSLQNEVVGRYTGPRTRDPGTDVLVADLPHVISYPDSHWRAQLGLRFDF